MSAGPIRVLLCDDHQVVRRGLRLLIEDAPDVVVVGEAGDAPEAMRAVRERIAGEGLDVVLLDIALPGRDGLDLMRQLRAEFPALAILVLSTYPERQYAVRSLQLGARGYLNKSADGEAILDAIRRAAAGGLTVGEATARALVGALGTDEAPIEKLLSHREYQVFRLLARGVGVGAIAGELSLSPNTVSTYRARILEKTGARNDVELALYAVRRGLIDPGTV